jgi:hypothetical protein
MMAFARTTRRTCLLWRPPGLSAIKLCATLSNVGQSAKIKFQIFREGILGFDDPAARLRC